MGLVCTCFQKCGARRACSLPLFCRTKDTGLTRFPGPGQPPDVRCISPASKSRRAASVQERSPLGVGVPRAIPAWRGWGLMLSGSEKLGTLGGETGDTGPLCPSRSLGSRHLGQPPAVRLLCYQKQQTQTLVLCPAVRVSRAQRRPSLSLGSSSVRR